MIRPEQIVRATALATVAGLALTGCAQHAAPVLDRGSPAGTVTPAAAPPAPAPVPAPLVREAKDGIYTVQRGDTLYSIALAFGVDHRELAQWNNIADGASIAVGQPLRVTPPATVAAVAPVAPSGATEVRPLPPTAPGGAITTIPAPASPSPMPEPPGPVPALPAPPEPAAAEPVEPQPVRPVAAVQFQWPATGKVIDTFDDPRVKGIGIAGNEGAPVQAAADGEVVYVGSAVRGYGNLVIVRHTADYITAYAHNRKILVREKDQVKRGQTIAEIGKSDTDKPKLHFEIRHQGKPVDPLKHLPAR
jgi:lipoprotein NlpD